MLSQELRPKTLDGMAGQEEAKRLIKAIIKNPENAPKVLLFCGSFGTGKCVTGDTRVHTSDGYKRIDGLVQNPEYDEEGFMDISPKNIKVVGDRLATHHYYGGKKKVVKISSREFSIKGTPNHRVKVYGGKGGLVWKRLDKITKDDYVAIPIKDVILFDNKSEDYSFFRGGASEFDKGFILGSIFSQSIGNGVDLSEMSDTIDISGNSASINSFCCRVDGLIEDISYNHVKFSHKDLSKYIYEYGLSHNVPEFVFSSNRKFIVGFLSAFFSFLGDYDFTVSSLSESVARDIQNLLYLLGIVSSVIETSTYKCKLSILHRRSREVFCDTIVISDDIQGVLLRKSICNMTSKEEYIPNNTYTKFITARIRHLLRSTALDDSLSSHINFDKWFSFIKYDDRKSLSLKSYHDVLEHANMDIFKDRTLKHFDTLLNTHIFIRVSEIKELSSYDVYDLTVEGTHTFTANGLINHNTTASRIVGRELNNIKDDNYDLLNSPFYYEFDSTVVGNVDEIKKLRDIFTVSFGDYWRIVVLDECVHYDTRIHVMDENGNTFLEKIGKLVSKKPKGWEALSVDDRGNFSYKPILNFFNNGKKDFYKVDIDGVEDSVVCTDNHRFFDINFNEVYLRDLVVGDIVSTLCGGILGYGVIKSIAPYKDSHVSAYDIEVADNHNYITSGGIILHNCHTVSATAQAAMLKMFEETKGKTIYILATTDPQKLLPTIRSRALEINFNDVPVEAIVDNLTKVSEERNLNLSEEIKLLIADRSGGHMRNAHMLLDKYILLGEEDFKDSIKSSVTLFCDYLIATYKNDKDAVLSNINDLLSIPKDNLQSDWSIVMTESLRSFCGFECRHKDIKRLVDTYGSDFNIIAQCYMSTWVKNMFIDIPYTQATLLNMYKVVQGALEKKRTQSGVGSVQFVASKYGRPVR
nr:MAG TPA: activator clamp loader [Caudoviricetes sp.]